MKQVVPYLPVKMNADASTWDVSGVCRIHTLDNYLAPRDVEMLAKLFPYLTRKKGFSFTGIGADGGLLILSFVWND